MSTTQWFPRKDKAQENAEALADHLGTETYLVKVYGTKGWWLLTHEQHATIQDLDEEIGNQGADWEDEEIGNLTTSGEYTAGGESREFEELVGLVRGLGAVA